MRNIIAILRGITPDEINPIAEALLAEGIHRIEVPLNSPNAFDSIERMINAFTGQGIFGAGTVLTVDEVTRLAGIGGRMVVSPNMNADVIRATKAARMASFPGVVTPSEAFAALDAGADALKFFPGELVTPVGLRAVRAVLPKETQCWAVGGAKPNTFADWVAAGANGFGLGSAIYKPADTAADVTAKARGIVTAYDEAFA